MIDQRRRTFQSYCLRCVSGKGAAVHGAEKISGRGITDRSFRDHDRDRSVGLEITRGQRDAFLCFGWHTNHQADHRRSDFPVLEAHCAAGVTVHANIKLLTGRGITIPNHSPAAVRRDRAQVRYLHREDEVCCSRRLRHRYIIDSELRIRVSRGAFRMGRQVLVNYDPRAGISHERGSHLVVAARRADAIYRDHPVVIGLTRVGGARIVISCLRARHGCEQGFSIADGAAKDLIINDW